MTRVSCVLEVEMICSCSVDTTAFVAIMTKADLNWQRPFSCGNKLHLNVSNDLFSQD